MMRLTVASPRSRITGGLESGGPKLPPPSLKKSATPSPTTARSTRSSPLNLPIATPRSPAAASCGGCSTKVPFAAPAFVKIRAP